MKDLTKVFINLSKCTEEQRKHIRTKIFNSEFPIATITRYILENMMEHRIKENPYLLINEYVHWKLNESIRDKTELTYPEFIKLFEGGEETEVQKLKKQIGLYKECFELFIPTDKWDEANEFLSINNNPLAKHLSKVQRGVEKKPKF